MSDSPDLRKFRWIVVNSSGGKDSQTALHVVVNQCDALGIDRDRIVVSHQDMGRVEWQGTLDLVKAQAAHYGLRLEISKYRTCKGEEIDLLEHVRRHGKWPGAGPRYCTSDHKRLPGSRVITMLSREAPGDVIQVMGFRAEESPARAKKVVLEREERLCTKTRTVLTWLPIHEWTQEQVWADIKASGVPYHSAYALGMPRLSCIFCIYAPKAALMIAGKANPELLAEYVAVEKEIGHSFQHNHPIADVQAAIARGDAIPKMTGNWNM